MRTSRRYVGSYVKCLLLFPILALAVGCGKEGNISGKVYYKGQLVKAGSVNFINDATGKGSASQISADGSYTISKLPPGPAKIAVVSGSPKAPGVSEMKEMGRGAQMAQKGMEKAKSRLQEKGKPAGMETVREEDIVHIPEKFGDAEKSGLTVTVTGGKQNFDIKIE